MALEHVGVFRTRVANRHRSGETLAVNVHVTLAVILKISTDELIGLPFNDFDNLACPVVLEWDGVWVSP